MKQLQLLLNVITAFLNNAVNDEQRILYLIQGCSNFQPLLLPLPLETPCSLIPYIQEPYLQLKRKDNMQIISVSIVEVLAILLRPVPWNIQPLEGSLISPQAWEMTLSSHCRLSLPGPFILFSLTFRYSCLLCPYYTPIFWSYPNPFNFSPWLWCLYLLYGSLFCTQTCLFPHQTPTLYTCSSCWWLTNLLWINLFWNCPHSNVCGKPYRTPFFLYHLLPSLSCYSRTILVETP